MKFNKVRSASAKAFTGILLSLYTMNASAAYGWLQEWRCAQDGAPNKTVEVIAQRLAWGMKCYPDLMETFAWSMDANANTYSFPGQGVKPIYPVFGTVNGPNVTVLPAPVDGKADCDVLQKLAPKQRITVIGFCGLGCLTGDQVVEFGQGPFAIGSKEAAAQAQVITLKEGANLSAMSFQATALRQIVTDLQPAKQKLLKITTADGHSIEVTVNHPLIDSQGLVRVADTLKVGESLARADGRTETITSIEQSEIFGRVYNVRVESPKLEENIYVSQGFLSGSIAIQNEEVDYLNRKLLRQGDLFSVN